MIKYGTGGVRVSSVASVMFFLAAGTLGFLKTHGDLAFEVYKINI
jgi:hypothetical protein